MRIIRAEELHKDISEVEEPDFTLHSLRHTFATRALEQDIPLKVVSDWLGHTTIRITGDIYSHALPAKRRNSIQRLTGITTDHYKMVKIVVKSKMMSKLMKNHAEYAKFSVSTWFFFGPSGESRTHGLLNPIQARYQTALHPDIAVFSDGKNYYSGFKINCQYFFCENCERILLSAPYPTQFSACL